MRRSRAITIANILDVIKFLLLMITVLMFINFNAEVAKQSENTAKIAANTNGLVRSQDDILKAIRQVTTDTRKTAEEQTSIIICMLQVPVSERTTDLMQQCRVAQGNGESPGSALQINSDLTGIQFSSPSLKPTAAIPLELSNTSHVPLLSPIATGNPPKELLDFLSLQETLGNDVLNRLRKVQ